MSDRSIAHDMPREFQRLAHFNTFMGGTKPNETVALTRIVDADGVEEFLVTVRILQNPDNYVQSWTFKGDMAAERAMRKCLAYTGWDNFTHTTP